MDTRASVQALDRHAEVANQQGCPLDRQLEVANQPDCPLQDTNRLSSGGH